MAGLPSWAAWAGVRFWLCLLAASQVMAGPFWGGGALAGGGAELVAVVEGGVVEVAGGVAEVAGGVAEVAGGRAEVVGGEVCGVAEVVGG